MCVGKADTGSEPHRQASMPFLILRCTRVFSSWAFLQLVLVLSVVFYGRFFTKKCGKISLCRGEEENKLRSEIAYTKHARIITGNLTAILSLLTVGKFLQEAGKSLEKMQQITDAAISAMVLANFLIS